jgi:two-component system response regulator FixJ
MPNTVHVIDDDEAVRDSLSYMLDAVGIAVRTYDSAISFLEQIELVGPGCIVTDVRMPEMSGLDLVRQLKERNIQNPMIVITGHGDVPLAVEAMKAGVVDFLEKPFDDDALLRAVRMAMAGGLHSQQDLAEKARLKAIFDALSPREQEVLQGVVDGKMNKNIAYDLGISARTVEVYRANVMSKTGAHGLSELVRMALMVRT